MNKEKKFIPASFGVDSGHIDRYYESCLGRDPQQKPLDILQTECAKLVLIADKAKYLKELFVKADGFFINAKDVVDRWHETRATLADEMAHVPILLAVVSRVYGITQEEIDANIQNITGGI